MGPGSTQTRECHVHHRPQATLACDVEGFGAPRRPGPAASHGGDGSLRALSGVRSCSLRGLHSSRSQPRICSDQSLSCFEHTQPCPGHGLGLSWGVLAAFMSGVFPGGSCGASRLPRHPLVCTGLSAPASFQGAKPCNSPRGLGLHQDRPGGQESMAVGAFTT